MHTIISRSDQDGRAIKITTPAEREAILRRGALQCIQIPAEEVMIDCSPTAARRRMSAEQWAGMLRGGRVLCRGAELVSLRGGAGAS